MSPWSELRSTLRSILVIEEKIDRLSAVVEKMAGHVEDHEKRPIRIGTMIERAPETPPAPSRVASPPALPALGHPQTPAAAQRGLSGLRTRASRQHPPLTLS